METSRLLSLEVENFMGYSYARVDFDDTNIISLKGYNSAGKTTIIRALAVINSDAWTMKQSKFIKYGANKFELIQNFSDGVKIVREKYLNGKSSYTMLKDGEEVFSTIQDGVYTSFKGVPDFIRKYLNLIDDSKLNLHIRRGRDDLLLVDTTGRENYEFLSSALKAEEVTTASGMLKTDRLGIKSDISAIEYKIEGYHNLVQKDRVITTPLVERLEGIDNNLQSNEVKKSKLEALFGTIEDYSQIKPSINLNKIGVSRVGKLTAIMNLINEYNGVQVSVPIKQTDSTRTDKILGILSSINEYNKYQPLPTMQKVEFSKVSKMTELLKDMQGLAQIEESINKNNQTIEQYKQNVLEIEEWLKQQKVQVFKCKSCGELQVAGETHHHA